MNRLVSASPLAPAATLRDLTGLRRSDLDTLHAQGECPDMAAFGGRIDGVVLTTPVVRELRLWRGKAFSVAADGQIGGMNRLGAGSVERLRYRFVASTGPSLFGDREVGLLDHDLPGNPPYIRRFHDELVEIHPGLYLATSHFKVRGQLRYLAHFALQLS